MGKPDDVINFQLLFGVYPDPCVDVRFLYRNAVFLLNNLLKPA